MWKGKGRGHKLVCRGHISMPTYSNFQINDASGETFKFFVAFFNTIKVVIFEKISPVDPFIWKLL